MDDHTLPEPSSPTPTSWQFELAMAAATGVVTAYLPVQRWPQTAQWAVHGGFGTLTAAATGWLMTRPNEAEDASTPPPPLAFTAAVALVGGLAVAGLSRGGQSADAWMERRLAARGVRRPRMWLGLAAAGASLAMSAAERRSDERAQTSPGSVGGGGEPGAGG